MTEKSRKRHSPEFKAKVAEAELAAEHGINEKLLHRWRAEVEARALNIEPHQELAETRRQLRRQERKISDQRRCLDFFAEAFPDISPAGNAKGLPRRGSRKD